MTIFFTKFLFCDMTINLGQFFCDFIACFANFLVTNWHIATMLLLQRKIFVTNLLFWPSYTLRALSIKNVFFWSWSTIIIRHSLVASTFSSPPLLWRYRHHHRQYVIIAFPLHHLSAIIVEHALFLSPPLLKSQTLSRQSLSPNFTHQA